MQGAKKRIIALFDLDQTLTIARKPIEKSMIDTLNACKEKGVAIGIVSGSDLNKIKE
jgi:hydroxymethylpyrimidine pyrophosphatase-like HAD family hydrolase